MAECSKELRKGRSVFGCVSWNPTPVTHYVYDGCTFIYKMMKMQRAYNILPLGTVVTNSCEATTSPSMSIVKVWLTLEATKKQKSTVHSVLSNLNLQKAKRRPTIWSESVLEQNATYQTKRESLFFFKLSLALQNHFTLVANKLFWCLRR